MGKFNLMIGYVLIGLITLSSAAQSEADMSKFLKIAPGRSTKSDVEQLLGAGQENVFSIYSNDDYRILIDYSDGTCRENWLIPAGIVVGAMMNFTQNRSLKELTKRVKLKDLRVIRSSDVEGEAYYYNDIAGISYAVNEVQREWISISLYPSKKFSKRVCKE